MRVFCPAAAHFAVSCRLDFNPHLRTLARLFLLHRNRGNMLLLGPSPVELIEPPIQIQAAAGNLPESVPFRDLIQLYASRGRGVHNPHGSFTKWTLPQPAPEIPWASAEGACAEVLNIVRPCAYAVARYFCADESWKPFLLSLTFDVSSRIFVGELSRLSRAQQEEVARRMMMWSYYFLRSPLFDKFTKYAEAHFLLSLSVLCMHSPWMYPSCAPISGPRCRGCSACWGESHSSELSLVRFSQLSRILIPGFGHSFCVLLISLLVAPKNMHSDIESSPYRFCMQATCLIWRWSSETITFTFRHRRKRVRRARAILLLLEQSRVVEQVNDVEDDLGTLGEL